MKKLGKNTKSMKPTEEYQPIVKQIFDMVENKVGYEDMKDCLLTDGVPIMVMKLLFGGMSSSQILEIYTDRYGFEECQRDLDFLKEGGWEQVDKEFHSQFKKEVKNDK